MKSSLHFWREAFLLFFIFVVIFLLATLIPRIKFKDPVEKISFEYEEKLGKVLLKSFLLKHHRIRNTEVVRAMNIIEKRLTEELRDFKYDIKIIVIKSPVINAVTLPGGYIIFFSGLLKAADTSEEVAAVLAHEIGHIKNRDSLKSVIRELGISTILAIFTQGRGGIMIDEIAHQLVSTAFSRQQELAADNFAIDLLIKSKINPEYLSKFFLKLKAKEPIDTKKIEFILTHPALQSRIENILKKSGEIKTKPIKINWKKVKASIQ